MPLRPLPDFLKCGGATLGLPRKSPYARFKAIIGIAQPPDPVLPEGTTHDAASAQEFALRDWLAHVRAGRIGGRSIP